MQVWQRWKRARRTDRETKTDENKAQPPQGREVWPPATMSKLYDTICYVMIQHKKWAAFNSLQQVCFLLSSLPCCRQSVNVHGVPDVVLKWGHVLLHRADLGVPLSHRLDQVAIGLLCLLQQLVGCQQLRNKTCGGVIRQLLASVTTITCIYWTILLGFDSHIWYTLS